MKVTIFRVMAEERWHSLDVYADNLVTCLRDGGFPLSVFSFKPSNPTLPPRLAALNIHWQRSLPYPLTARAHQGEINHVIDHSYGHLLYFLDRSRTIVTCNDLIPIALRNSYPRLSPARALWDWAQQGMLKAARIIAISQSTRRDLLRYTSYPGAQIKVVYDGFDPSFHPIKDEEALSRARTHLGLLNGGFVLHVGHCAPRKNVEAILYALQDLREEEVFFLQVGGTFSPAQRRLIARLGLEGRVIQVRGLSRKMLPLVYNLARAFVFPSYYEGFGLPVLEAMACGLPVVCANTSSLPEVVGEAALQVAPDDYTGLAQALRRVLDDEGLRQKMREEGPQRASLFTWERCAQETFEVYQDLYRELYG